MKDVRFSHVVTASIPERLAPHTLYVTTEGDVAGHLCACGCGREVITPLSPTDWSLTLDKGGASLLPSIGNWSFPCRSHYFIHEGAIVWAREMSLQAIDRGRTRDKAQKRRYYEKLTNVSSPLQQPSVPVPREHPGRIYLWRWIVDLCRRWFDGCK